LQKSPCFGVETVAPSPRETTGRARAPRPKRREELRCRTRLVISTARADPARTYADSGFGRARDGVVTCGCEPESSRRRSGAAARGMMRRRGAVAACTLSHGKSLSAGQSSSQPSSPSLHRPPPPCATFLHRQRATVHWLPNVATCITRIRTRVLGPSTHTTG
jgi:hypothetical protein